ncbi:MAG: hypothetical protein KatS3mg105_0410 [Gemmatales bacterium]|nr:MAG: hypothetical protein KatS3mg105_0410 [Gemmatales bacterium]
MSHRNSTVIGFCLLAISFLFAVSGCTKPAPKQESKNNDRLLAKTPVTSTDAGAQQKSNHETPGKDQASKTPPAKTTKISKDTSSKNKETNGKDTSSKNKGTNGKKPSEKQGLKSWPMFGGTPLRNPVNLKDQGIPSEWSVSEGKQKNVKWSAQLGTTSYGGPIIADGKIFVGTNNGHPRNPDIQGDKGVLMCFRQSDGAFLWQAVHDKLASGQDNDWPRQGIASSPAVEGKRVYYVSNRCEVVCADTEGFLDGKNDGVQDEVHKGKTDADIIWRLDMIKELGVYPKFLSTCSPVIGGDLLFIVTANGVNEDFKVVNPKAPSFIAVDKHTGKVVWQDNSPGDQIMEGQWGNPAYVEVNGVAQAIFPGGDGWLYSFEAKTGKLIWKFNCNPPKAVFKPGGGGDKNYFLSTPVIYDNKCYIGVGRNPDDGSDAGHLWCIDITKKGDVSPKDDKFNPKDPVNKDSALVWHVGGKIDPPPKTIGREWHFGRTLSTCCVHDGLVYVAELDGYFYCFDAATGKQYWVYDMKTSTWGTALYVDNKVLVTTEEGDVLVFRPGKKLEKIAANNMEAGLKSTPVVVDGVLYILTDSKLYAIEAQ